MQLVRTLLTPLKVRVSALDNPPYIIQQVKVEMGGWVQLLESVTSGLLPSHHLVFDVVGCLWLLG